MTNKTKDHYEAIAETAKEILSDLGIKTKEDCEQKQDDIYTRIHEESDNAVIYYSDVDKILEATNNDEAYQNTCIELKGSFQEIKTAVAFWAYDADLREAISELESDLPYEDDLEEVA